MGGSVRRGGRRWATQHCLVQQEDACPCEGPSLHDDVGEGGQRRRGSVPRVTCQARRCLRQRRFRHSAPCSLVHGGRRLRHQGRRYAGRQGALQRWWVIDTQVMRHGSEKISHVDVSPCVRLFCASWQAAQPSQSDANFPSLRCPHPNPMPTPQSHVHSPLPCAQELEAFAKVLDAPARPVLAILGGAKVSPCARGRPSCVLIKSSGKLSVGGRAQRG